MLSDDIKFMKIALALARSGIGKTFPKPSVGAAIAKDGILVSAAVTSAQGTHAEPQAITQAGADASGSTLYVTLEPCNHFGTTPPCTNAIIAAGIKRVVIANTDRNPATIGGVEKLRKAGIEVITGICADEAMEINLPFFHTIEKKRPYIIVKIGSSLDGKIALENGMSKYITGELSRDYVQVLRAKCDAIMVGISTILSDDPLLSCRLPGLEKKLPKIILDRELKITESHRLIKNSGNDPVIIFSAKNKPCGNAGIIETPVKEGMLDIEFVLSYLASEGYQRLLVEGGGKVISSLLSKNLVDELQIVYAPKLLGGSAISFASQISNHEIPENNFSLIEQRNLGEDILLKFKNNFPD